MLSISIKLKNPKKHQLMQEILKSLEPFVIYYLISPFFWPIAGEFQSPLFLYELLKFIKRLACFSSRYIFTFVLKVNEQQQLAIVIYPIACNVYLNRTIVQPIALNQLYKAVHLYLRPNKLFKVYRFNKLVADIFSHLC